MKQVNLTDKSQIVCNMNSLLSSLQIIIRSILQRVSDALLFFCVLSLLLIFVTLAFFGLACSGLLLAVGLRTRKAETVSAVDHPFGLSAALCKQRSFPNIHYASLGKDSF